MGHTICLKLFNQNFGIKAYGTSSPQRGKEVLWLKTQNKLKLCVLPTIQMQCNES